MPTLAEIKAGKAAEPADPTPEPHAPYEPGDEPPEETKPTLAKAQPSGNRTPVARDTLAEQEDLLNIAWYGDGGTGKTTDIATAANHGTLVLINAEDGIKRRALERQGINTANIEIVPRRGEPLTYELLDNLFWDLKSDLEQGKGPVAVGWDSVTEITKVVLSHVSGDRVAKALRTGKGSTDPYFTDLSDYGTMTDMMRALLRRYRDLPCHLLISALERRDTDDDGKVIYRPALTPAFSTDVYGYMDAVIHTETLEPNDGGANIYRGLTSPVGKFRAKDRLGALPKYLVDPTFERVLGYVTDELDVGTDPVQADAIARTTKPVEQAPEDAG